MSCRDNDTNSCCGQLVYKSECLICSSIALIAKTLDFRNHIRIRPITDQELKEFRAPVFYGDEGALVRGILPCFKRVFWELFLPTHSKYEVHGDRIFPKGRLDKLIQDSKHCFVCKCQMGRCCQYCKAVPKVEKNFPTTGANVAVVEGFAPKPPV